MDTGLIDSHGTLGINSKTSDRIQFRKFTSCAIIHIERYTYTVNSNDDEDKIIRYYYGRDSEHEYTFEYDTKMGYAGYVLT